VGVSKRLRIPETIERFPKTPNNGEGDSQSNLRLEKQSLLRIHGRSLLWVNRKEVAIKPTRVLVEKISVLNVRALIIVS
jgi:hypothetical protein